MASTWYTCARKMAVGGMAELLLASQQGLAGFEKLVAIKRILPRLREDKRFVQMFLDEARLAARLRHPCIAEIYDVRREELTYQVVMEYLSGEDLGYVLRTLARAESRVPISYACRIMADVADGLSAAHTATDVDGTSHGIIHRDVSPANIVVTYDGVTKLVDFGVAKANENHIYTRPGTIRGKLPYMSPEQVSARELDGRSDLFSLGAVFHEMLTSRRLFSGPSESAILKNVMERRIPPPSVYNPRVSPALDDLVLSLLERDPERRMASAGLLRDRLERLMHADGVTQRKVGEWMRGALAPRYQKRRAIERQIVEQARVASKPTLDSDELPPMFGDDEEGGAGPAHAVISAAAGASPSSGTFSRLSASVSTPTQERQEAAAAAASGRPRGRSGPWVALGSAFGVIALGAAAFFLYGGRAGSTASPPELAPLAVAAGGAAPAPAPALPAPAPAPDTVGMLVHVVPEAATLEIDGQAAAQRVGPDGLLVPVPAGADVRVRITKDGYVAHEATLRTPSAGTMPIYVTLGREGATPDGPALAAVGPIITRPRAGGGAAARAAELVVAFEPAGARLALDGAPYPGGSPYRAELGPGSHTVTVQADGHETVTKRFDVAPGATYEMTVHLSRAAERLGRVDFHSSPSGARVSIDGELKGRTPIVGLELPVGRRHAVAVTLEGHETYLTEITPRAEQPLTVEALLSERETAPPAVALGTPFTAPAPAPARAAPAPAALAPMPRPVPTSAPVARKPAGWRVVPPGAVTKVSGTLPRLEAKRLPTASGISVKLCIDERGAVASATLGGKLPAELHAKLERAFRAWRYQPYVESGITEPVCFAVVFSLNTAGR